MAVKKLETEDRSRVKSVLSEQRGRNQ